MQVDDLLAAHGQNEVRATVAVQVVEREPQHLVAAVSAEEMGARQARCPSGVGARQSVVLSPTPYTLRMRQL